YFVQLQVGCLTESCVPVTRVFAFIVKRFRVFSCAASTNGTIKVMEGQYDGIYDVLLRNTVSYTWYCSISVYYGWGTKN
ncbi:hypothetical protein ACT7C1_15360, partial [Bacillus paranthracis]